jgi:hypothetical protein
MRHSMACGGERVLPEIATPATARILLVNHEMVTV